jgi:hypothetical protein
VSLNKLVDLFIDYYYITMPTTGLINGYYWNYMTSGSNATSGSSGSWATCRAAMTTNTPIPTWAII